MKYSITIKNGLPILVQRITTPVSRPNSEKNGSAFGHCIVNGEGFLFINENTTELN